MRIPHRRAIIREVAVALLIIMTLSLIYQYCKMKRVEDVDEKGIDNSDNYFAAIDTQSHPRCRMFRQAFPIVWERDGDVDIAFTLVVHKDVGQIARLMRMIHRTNNYYCIHADARSSQRFMDALKGALTCFGANAELVPPHRQVEVHWGDESVMMPQLICAQQALRRHTSWKYLINLVGQDFPLRTNLELVAALKALNGSNLIESFSINQYRSRVGNATLPLNATWYKGSIYGAYRREFLEEAILGRKVEPIRKFIMRHRAFGHPDELLLPTLAYNPHLNLPGSCLVAPSPISETGSKFLGKYVIWNGYNITCPTKYVRDVCILGGEHVDELKMAPHISANKFHAEYEPEAYSAMEQWYFEKVKRERSIGSYSKQHFDPRAYAVLTCSRIHI